MDILNIKKGTFDTFIDTIEEFVSFTVNSDTLGCDKEFIRTNMFDVKKSLIVPHGWNTDVIQCRFRDFCRNGKEYLHDPANYPLMILWRTLYDEYRAHKFFEHYVRASTEKGDLERGIMLLSSDMQYHVRFTTEVLEGRILHTEFIVNKEDK